MGGVWACSGAHSGIGNLRYCCQRRIARQLLELIEQVSSPVRWDLCMDAFVHDGVTGVIELAPAGALVGLAKRGLKGIPTVAVKSPDDLVAAIELLEAS